MDKFLKVNTLYNEDCLEGMKRIPDHSIDMVIADPPYGVTRLQYDTQIDMDAFFLGIWRIAKPNAAVLVFGVEPFSSQMRLKQLRTFRYDYIWQKTLCTGLGVSQVVVDIITNMEKRTISTTKQTCVFQPIKPNAIDLMRRIIADPVGRNNNDPTQSSTKPSLNLISRKANVAPVSQKYG